MARLKELVDQVLMPRPPERKKLTPVEQAQVVFTAAVKEGNGNLDYAAHQMALLLCLLTSPKKSEREDAKKWVRGWKGLE